MTSRQQVVLRRWQLAGIVGTHPSTISVWLHQGLDIARVPGGFDLDRAIEWLKATGRTDVFKIDQAAVAKLRAAAGVGTQRGGNAQ